MAKIEKAIYKPERRVVTISEFQSMFTANPYRRSFIASNLICVECGDEITYCQGEINRPYFKHNPSRFGGKHVNCSLFTQGAYVSENESSIRKKFVEDTDVTLNFEIKMIGNKWSSFVTIPPFITKELDSYSSKNTVISIKTKDKTIAEISIDKEHFSRGEIKSIGLNGFPCDIFINITSSESAAGLYYRIDGFSPNAQIYKTLISDEFVSDKRDTVNLTNKKFFSCKRCTGKIFTGRHYLIFVNDSGYGAQHFNSLYLEDYTAKKIILPKDSSFSYTVYDVVFNHCNERTKEFCEKRDCVLSEESDATILWPPVNYVGNYKYYKNNSTNLFIAFENKQSTLDLYMNDISNLSTLKIKNENIQPYYLTVAKTAREPKEMLLSGDDECSEVIFEDQTSNYLFSNNVLLNKIDSRSYKLKKKESIISIKNRLDYHKYHLAIEAKGIDHNKILSLIRYSPKYCNFKDEEYKFLKEKYESNGLIQQYLDLCIKYKRIKETVLDYLMEER